MEDYSEAVEHYSYALQRQPTFEQALLRRNAVLCQAKLHHKLEQQHESLKRTLDELRKFKGKTTTKNVTQIIIFVIYRKTGRISKAAGPSRQPKNQPIGTN